MATINNFGKCRTIPSLFLLQNEISVLLRNGKFFNIFFKFKQKKYIELKDHIFNIMDSREGKCYAAPGSCLAWLALLPQPSAWAEWKSTHFELSLFWPAIGWSMLAAKFQPIAGQNRLSSKCVDFLSAQPLGCARCGAFWIQMYRETRHNNLEIWKRIIILNIRGDCHLGRIM